MANRDTKKQPIAKNVVYDSRNDVATGKKRAVQMTGGISVAERARLFGTQVHVASASKPPKPPQPPPTIRKPNPIQQDRNYQTLKPNNDRPTQQETAYARTSPVRPQDTYRPPQYYSVVTHPQDYQPLPPPTYDTFQYKPPPPPAAQRQTIPQRTTSDYYASDGDELDYDPYDTYQKPHQSSASVHNLNHFQPIQDPLEALYKDSQSIYTQPQRVPQSVYNQPPQPPPSVYAQPQQVPPSAYAQQQQVPPSVYTQSQQAPPSAYTQSQQIPPPIYSQPQQIPPSTNPGIQPFDLGNLINRIQEDYLTSAQPYVSSIQFVQSEQNLANIGYVTPSINRKDYARRSYNSSYQKGTTYYEIIDPSNGLYPAYSKEFSNTNNYSSMKRTKQRRRYHDQASSPIHFEESNKQSEREKSPSVSRKSPAPNESEDEETAATTTQGDASKTTEAETSEEEEEEEEEEAESPVTQPIPLKPPTSNPLPRPILPNPTPAKKVETSGSSESEESGSDDDTESEEEDEKPPPKIQPKSTPVPTRSTPQITPRVVPKRISTDTSNTNQPPEIYDSKNSFDVENSRKPSAIGSKFKSITNKFRRNKS